MLHLSCMSLHNAKLESTLLEGLPGEHTLVDSSILENFRLYLKIFLSLMHVTPQCQTRLKLLRFYPAWRSSLIRENFHLYLKIFTYIWKFSLVSENFQIQVKTFTMENGFSSFWKIGKYSSFLWNKKNLNENLINEVIKGRPATSVSYCQYNLMVI